jgi:hypothetical protein
MPLEARLEQKPCATSWGDGVKGRRARSFGCADEVESARDVAYGWFSKRGAEERQMGDGLLEGGIAGIARRGDVG